MNVILFLFLAFVLSLLDIVYTFYNVRILKQHEKQWADAEYNPLVRTSWHIFGLMNGTLLAGAITLIFVLLLAYIIGEREFFQGFLIGMFVIVHHYHYINYAYLSKKYLKKKTSLLEKIIMKI